MRYLCNTTTDLHKIWHDDAERDCVSSAPHIKNVILKIQDGGRTADMLE